MIHCIPEPGFTPSARDQGEGSPILRLPLLLLDNHCDPRLIHLSVRPPFTSRHNCHFRPRRRFLHLYTHAVSSQLLGRRRRRPSHCACASS